MSGIFSYCEGGVGDECMSRERGSAVDGVIQVNQLRLQSDVFTSD